MSASSRQVSACSAVRCFAWNESGSVLVVGTNDGFITYSTEVRGTGAQGGRIFGGASGNAAASFTELASRRIRGGVGHIAVHGQSNIIVYCSLEEPNVAVLWNDALAERTEADTISHLHGVTPSTRQCAVAHITLPTAVVGVRLHPSCILLAEASCIHVLNEQLKEVEVYDTPTSLALTTADTGNRGIANNDNSLALASHLSSRGALHMLLVGHDIGDVRMIKYIPSASGKEGISCKTAKPHTSPIRTLCISTNGTLGATVSEKGTAIKLIDVGQGAVLTQLNRGTTPSAVSSMTFNPEATMLSCLSETGTLHFFAVSAPSPPTSITAGVGVMLGSSGKLANPKSKIAKLSNAAKDYVAGVKWAANAAAYVSSEYALTTFALGSIAGGTTVAEDIENESSDMFSSIFAAIAMGPTHHPPNQHVRHIHLFAAQGNNESVPPSSESEMQAAGQVGFSGPRCKLVRVVLSLDAVSGTANTERLSTHYFPHEEL